jgi:hypothetical protein
MNTHCGVCVSIFHRNALFILQAKEINSMQVPAFIPQGSGGFHTMTAGCVANKDE